MPINAEYLGMPLGINDLDIENKEFFRHCSEGNFHLQACEECSLLRYPPNWIVPLLTYSPPSPFLQNP